MADKVALSIKDTITRIQSYKRPNSVNARNLLEQFDTEEYDGLIDSLELLDEYESMDRNDYDSQEEYSEERSDAWDNFTESLDSIELIPEA